jgi:hypothetical protein
MNWKKKAYQLGLLCIVLLLSLVGTVNDSTAYWQHTLFIDLEDADLTLAGEDEGDWTGYFASPAGDVNGDGLGDALVGAPMAGNKECPYPEEPDGSCPGLAKGEGVGYLVLGKPGGGWSPNPLNLADADASFLGCEVTSMTARQLYTAGDVNGDGFDDILISGWKCADDYRGLAYLFLGRADVNFWGHYYSVDNADAIFVGECTQDFLSYYVSTAGDVNGDGYDDFLISSTHYDLPLDPSDPCDLDESLHDPGKVYLILGRASANWGKNFNLANADASFIGLQDGDRIGRSQTGVGDVNGDGYDDFLIGAKSSDTGGVDAGENYLFLGRADVGTWGQNRSVSFADASFVGEEPGDESGRRVAAAGDVNGDGLDDMLMQSALNDYAGPDAGIAYLVLGRASANWGTAFPLANADASFTGEVRRDQAARRLSGAGDVNGDGYDDFLIGAPHFSDNEEGGEGEPELPGFNGRSYLIYGRPAVDWGLYYPLSQADVIHVGKPEVGVAGYDNAWLDDFNGDGIDDYMIAAYGGRNNWTVAGEAYVVLGSATPQPMQFLPDYHEVIYTWQRFTGEFWEPNGWADIKNAELVLEDISANGMGFRVSYDHATNAIRLRNSSGSSWIGPCTAGSANILENEVLQLDCKQSGIKHDENHVMRMMWRIRWKPQSTSTKPVFNVKLLAKDLSGNDSGYVNFGEWGNLPVQVFMPVLFR